MARTPTDKTLRRYGLTLTDWQAILKRQGGVCAVCRRLPTNGRLCIDHEHLKNWKKLKPRYRRLYVRGLLCFFCNHYYVGRAITVERAQNVVDYLRSHNERKLNP